jgi:phosphatidylserine decarboxylase
VTETGFHRSALFLRAYRFLPHAMINRATARLMRAERPRWLVDAAIRAWIARDGIDMADYQEEAWPSVERFFLRRLKPGARPLGEGLVSPVDGRVVDVGTIRRGRTILVKDRPISVERLVNGRRHALPLADYEGGHYAVIFLSPRGYHRVHMPFAGTLTARQWLPGRFFPQNDDALVHIDAVYERNEREVLSLDVEGSGPALLVMVGASLVGGIHVGGLRRRDKGEELGHFSFGSTVVLLFRRGAVKRLAVTHGQALVMGQSIGALG